MAKKICAFRQILVAKAAITGFFSLIIAAMPCTISYEILISRIGFLLGVYRPMYVLVTPLCFLQPRN
jgi:hypothetical protein